MMAGNKELNQISGWNFMYIIYIKDTLGAWI